MPWGATCAVSGRPTRDVIQIEVQCEHLAPAKDPVKFALLLAMCAGPWATLILFSKPGQAHGRDTAVTVPLRVCREYHRGLERWWGRRKLRRLLRTVPVYTRLLDEYPRATIAVVNTLLDIEDFDTLISKPMLAC